MNYYGIIEDERNNAAFCMNSINSGDFPAITRENHLGRADDTRRDVISSSPLTMLSPSPLTMLSSSPLTMLSPSPLTMLSNNQVKSTLDSVPEPFRSIPRLSESLTEPDGQNYVLSPKNMKRFFMSIITSKKRSKDTFFKNYLKYEHPHQLLPQRRPACKLSTRGDDSTTDDAEKIDDSDAELKNIHIVDFENNDTVEPSLEFNDKDCIPWKGKLVKIKKHQYPAFYANRKKHSPKKFMYHWFVGSLSIIEKEMDERGNDIIFFIKNTCQNKCCVNPAHLLLYYKCEDHMQVRKEDPFTWQQCFSDPFFSLEWPEKEKTSLNFFSKKNVDFKKTDDSKQQDQEEENNSLLDFEEKKKILVDFFVAPFVSSYSDSDDDNNDNKNKIKKRKISIGGHHGKNTRTSSAIVSGWPPDILNNSTSFAPNEEHINAFKKLLQSKRKRNRII